MTSRHARRPAPRHRTPTPPRSGGRTGRLGAAAAAVVTAVALTVGVTAHVRVGGVPTATPSVSTSVSLEPPLVVTPGGGSPVQTYAGAEARTVLDRSRPVSRDSARQALAEATGRPARLPESGQGRQRDAGLAELAARAEQEAAALTRAWVLPLAPGYRVSAGFGECSSLWAHCHTGLDLAAPSGTPVRAVAEGTVTEVGWAGAYGNRTVQTLEDGTELWYCHLESIGVRLGDEVAAGQELGRVGSTGNSTGPHLHLEVRPGAGDPVDPVAALAAHGVTP